MSADFGCLLLTEKNYEKLTVRKASGQSELIGTVIDLEDSLFEQISKTKETLIIFDCDKENSEKAIKFRSETKSQIIAPMITEDEIIGFIDIEGSEANHFSEDDKDIELLANQAAVAIQNAERVSELREKSKKLQESERFKIIGSITADFIHLVGNKIGIVPRYIENISEQMKDMPKNVKRNLDSITQVSEEIIVLKEVLLGPFRTTKLKKVDIREILEQTLTVMRIPQEHNLRHNFGVIHERMEVFANPDELKKVFIDIITNAIESMEKTKIKRLTLSLKKDLHKNNGVLSVKDTGCGIKDSEQIFRPFYTTKGEKGYGLGLFSARNTLMKFNSQIDVKSVVNKGTTVKLTFPLES